MALVKKRFRLTQNGIKLVPITGKELIGALAQMGMPIFPTNCDVEAGKLNAKIAAALDEANRQLELSESASTNDIEAYIKGHPPTALAIAVLAQVASARKGKSIANARHSKPGGSRDKQNQIREIWASGKYTSRDICADEEAAALGMSRKAARNALIGTPKPK